MPERKRAAVYRDGGARQAMTILRTERLVLRPLAEVDVDAMHAAWNHREVGRFLWDGRAVGRDEVEEVVAASERTFRARGWGIWAIVEGGERASERVVGFCGLRPAPFATGIEGDVELLYGLERSGWGRGI